jgi:hypothetical protein
MVSKAKAWLAKNASLIMVLVVVFGICGGTLYLSVHNANSIAKNNAAIDAKIRAAQEKAGQITEVKLCTSFHKLSALEPPPGNPATNPSRAYLQTQHDVLVQLGQDIGCKPDPPTITTRQQENALKEGYKDAHLRVPHSHPSSPEPR